MNTLDIIIVGSLVGASALYLFLKAKGSLSASKKGKSCDHCSS